MLELSVRFTSDEGVEDSPISVSFFRPDSGVSTSLAPFVSPLGDGELKELRWYLEQFHRWPREADYDRAERIKAQLEDWGRKLLESVTVEREAARLWQQFVDAEDEGKLVTVDATDPRVLRLPWELLADAAVLPTRPNRPFLRFTPNAAHRRLDSTCGESSRGLILRMVLRS